LILYSTDIVEIESEPFCEETEINVTILSALQGHG